MKCLLDTHTLIWALINPSKISKRSSAIIRNNYNEIFVSALSFWEISLKFSLDKLDLQVIKPDSLPRLCFKSGFKVFSLNAEEASAYHLLPKIEIHKDFFDKMLIWQAIKQDLTVIFADRKFHQYHQFGLKTYW